MERPNPKCQHRGDTLAQAAKDNLPQGGIQLQVFRISGRIAIAVRPPDWDNSTGCAGRGQGKFPARYSHPTHSQKVTDQIAGDVSAWHFVQAHIGGDYFPNLGAFVRVG